VPKQSTKGEFNSFVKGLITEASPLNFPKDASLEEENFELNRDGSRQRRKGMANEPFATYQNTSLSLSNFLAASPTTYKWAEAGGVTSRNIVVVQAGNVLYYYDMNVSSLSSEGYLGQSTLVDFPSDSRYSITSVDGYLVVAAGVGIFAVINYDGSAFSVDYERIAVRDVWGVEV
jgi:hypothetical protein